MRPDPVLRPLAYIIGLVALLTGCGATSEAITTTASAPASDGNAVVKRVVDGDTLVATIGKKSEHVRLIGMDTPETVDPHRPVGCYGHEASNATKSLLPTGTAITLVRDVEERDKYGRLLAYVYRAKDNLFVNAELVRLGFANTLTIPPNVTHESELHDLAIDAREHDRGLWSACTDKPGDKDDTG